MDDKRIRNHVSTSSAMPRPSYSRSSGAALGSSFAAGGRGRADAGRLGVMMLFSMDELLEIVFFKKNQRPQAA